MDNPAASDTGFDLDSSVATIANGLGLDAVEPDETEAPVVETPEAEVPEQAATTPEAPATRQPPKSWAKEKHELWAKLPPDAQEYYEQREKQMLDGIEQYKGDAGFAKDIRNVIAPYRPILAAQGVTEQQAVQYLLNAHYKLTQGSPEERATFYRQLGQDLGFVAGEEVAEVLDPAVKQLQQELHEVKSNLTARQQEEYRQVKAKADDETNAFASDPANVYFNEVAQDMLPFVRQGQSLKDAYDKAVWANPVTREKEIARRQTEDAAKLREKAKTEGEAARKAMNTNVRGAQTQKAPTDPKGSMEDTMRDTLKKIKERAH